jgi:demethylmenaquinone methyltransferase/2-methoxy-6-polyprenyl-1,4-benzoquinol methylase
MDADLRRRMLAYYDERAPDYEEAYTLGTGTASITDPAVFTREIPQLVAVVRGFGQGRLLDLACGTGYWLPHYADGCASITLFDQSSNMLAEARAKTDRLGITARCAFRCGDFFDSTFEPSAYDRVLVGFFLSHLTEDQEPALFDSLRRMLAPGGRCLILDSAWTPERATVNTREERQQRRLNSGATFEIYKRYCDRADIAGWTSTYGATLKIEHFGTAFYAVSGTFAS